MKFSTLILPAALMAGLSVPGVASAHTVIGGWSVSDENAPRVEAYCRNLAIQGRQSLVGNGDDPGDPSSGDPGGIAQALTDADLGTITLNNCRDAGLVPYGRVVAPEVE